jgi:two-component system, chemotaxis family, protein-glutamate methylesterase/glutaminase
MRQILASLPVDFPAPILYLQHANGSRHSPLADVLQRSTALKVRWAQERDRLVAGFVYLCPAGWSVAVHPDGTMILAPTTTSREVLLHSADRLFTSVAASYGPHAVTLVLSGSGWDGREGVCAVHERQGTVLVQDESSALQCGMPHAAIVTGCVDLVLRLADIAPVLVSLVRDERPPLALGRSADRLVKRRHVAVSSALVAELDRLLGMALATHGTDLGNVQLVEPQTGELFIVAQRGFGMDFLEHFETVRGEDESACARAMRAQKPVLIADVTTDARFAAHRGIASAAGFRAVQSIPLISRDRRLVGMLSTHFRVPQRFSEARLQAFDQLIGRRGADLVEKLWKPHCSLSWPTRRSPTNF